MLRNIGGLYSIHLRQYRDQLLHIKSRWSNHLSSSIRFESHVEQASLVASQVTGHPDPPCRWIYVENNVTDTCYDSDDPDQDHTQPCMLEENDVHLYDLPTQEEQA